MRSSLTVLCVAIFTLTSFAQNPMPKKVSPVATSSVKSTGLKLPVRKVVLYKNGVGYFEHIGRVRGSQEFAIQFNSSQLNDVIKSLTIVDLGGGSISNVRYDASAPAGPSRTLQLGDDTTRASLLNALRGTRVEIRSDGAIATGRLLGVERETKTSPHGERSETTLVSLLTDTGELRAFELRPSTSVRISEGDLREEVSRHLANTGSSRVRDVRRMMVSTEGAGEREVFLSYISEVPVWKSTYRILLPSKPGEKTLLLGWAVVDNTVGEDWKDVQLSLIAGEPQSFIQQISRPYYLRRAELPLPTRAALAPQTHEGALVTYAPAPSSTGAPVTSLRGTVVDPTGAVVPNTLVTVRNDTTGSSRTTRTDHQGRYFFNNIEAGNSALFIDAPGFQRYQLTNFYLGVGRDNEIHATLQVASTSQAVEVVGSVTRVESTASYTIGAVRKQTSEAEGKVSGDVFEYAIKHPVTVLKNQSALVPIVHANLEAEKVTIISDIDKEPLRALWITNTSGLTLDGGTINVIEDDRFAGEAVVETIRPAEKRLVSYASDTAVRFRIGGEEDEIPITSVRVARGKIHITRKQHSPESIPFATWIHRHATW